MKAAAVPHSTFLSSLHPNEIQSNISRPRSTTVHRASPSVPASSSQRTTRFGSALSSLEDIQSSPRTRGPTEGRTRLQVPLGRLSTSSPFVTSLLSTHLTTRSRNRRPVNLTHLRAPTRVSTGAGGRTRRRRGVRAERPLFLLTSCYNSLAAASPAAVCRRRAAPLTSQQPLQAAPLTVAVAIAGELNNAVG